jgi:hypothetical protein
MMRSTSWGLALLTLSACSDDGKKPPVVTTPEVDAAQPPPAAARMTRAQLMDPETCGSCHKSHYDEWRSSMHAYAADDPVFIAMNKRGQRETDGAMGDFCVQCHAPMATREKLTTDGLNLEQVPQWAKGVTCYFCHNATDVGPDHFNANVLLGDPETEDGLTMRGALKAIDPGVHAVEQSPHFRRNAMESAVMCGTCHDVVNDHGTHIERTLAEYKDSVFSIDKGIEGKSSCQGCHMPFVEDAYLADMPELKLPKRERHQHRWPGVDVALTDFPDKAGRAANREATECELGQHTRIFEFRYLGPRGFELDLETDAGHNQPSGTAQDRRMWLEFIAYDAQDRVIYKSGFVPDDKLHSYPEGEPESANDPDLCIWRDHHYDDAGNEVHMFWEAKRTEGVAITPGAAIGAPHGYTCRYTLPGGVKPARVTARVRMRPVGLDVLQSLVDSGDLDAAVMQEMPTFTLHDTAIEWRPEDGSTVPDYLLRKLPRPSYCD